MFSQSCFARLFREFSRLHFTFFLLLALCRILIRHLLLWICFLTSRTIIPIRATREYVKWRESFLQSPYHILSLTHSYSSLFVFFLHAKRKDGKARQILTLLSCALPNLTCSNTAFASQRASNHSRRGLSRSHFSPLLRLPSHPQCHVNNSLLFSVNHQILYDQRSKINFRNSISPQ